MWVRFPPSVLITSEIIDKQLRYDLAYLKMALEWGKLSHCTRKKVGAIIVKNRMIISDGFNGAPTGFNNDCEDEKGETNWFVLHAEANAILKVAKSTNSCDQATLYLTLSPCKECAKLIHQSGIKRLVYLKKYKDTTGLNFLIKAGVIIEQINFEDFEK
ncbi:MAG: dCMP deaminase family protein [Flavobacteriales bacterium]|nr:dCMP deaminase family protein [Flavobacteriales bacterium]